MKNFEDVCTFLNDTKEQIRQLEETISSSERYLKYGNAGEIIKFKSRGVELAKTKAHHESEHRECTHLKGGTVFRADGEHVEFLRPYSKGGDGKKPWNDQDQETDRYAVSAERSGNPATPNMILL